VDSSREITLVNQTLKIIANENFSNEGLALAA
jgi:hypothetical protein